MKPDYLAIIGDGGDSLQPAFYIGWQEQVDYFSYEADTDAFAMYCMMSV